MNLWQVLQQLEYKGKKIVWEDSPAEIVFSDVIASLENPAFFLGGDMITPYLLFAPDTTDAEEENETMETAFIKGTIVAEATADRRGRNILIGAHNVTTIGNSDLQGILRLKTRLVRAMRQLGRSDGFLFMFKYKGSRFDASGRTGAGTYAALLECSFETIIVEKETFFDVGKFSTSVVGANVTITWVDPPDRFDLLSIQICRKLNTDPTGPTDSQLSVISLTTQTLADTPGVGAWHYAAFAQYDQSYKDAPTTANRWADGKFSTATVV